MAPDVERERRFTAVAEAVYEPLQRFLGRRARPDDVSELLNDVLLVIWRRLDDVPDDDVRPWAYGVAKRCLANQRRGDSRRLRLVGRLAAQPHSPDPLSEHTHDPLARAMTALSDAEQEVVRLWAWEQLEPREIAIAIDSTPNAVSLTLGRAKKKLAVAMERQNQTDAGHVGFGHGKEPRS